MKYQAVIFDIDGTLLDSVDLHAESWRQILVKYGKDVSFEAVRGQIGKGGDQLLPVFCSAAEVENYGEEMEKARGVLFKKEFLPRVKPFPKVRALFERLQQSGLKVALASSSKKDEVKHYARLLQIEDLIEAATSTDDAAKSKPHPDIFQAAIKKLGGLPPGEILAVGDTPYDAEAAAKAGMSAIGMLCGGFPAESLRRENVVAIYDDPADLLRQYDASPFV